MLTPANTETEVEASSSRTAVVSACGTYRYRLGRRWDHTAPPLCFVMLNPSTADHVADDATIRKCVGFASRYGYGALDVVNLFAYRATNPACLRAAGFPIGPLNDGWIETAARAAGDVVVAWGAQARARPSRVRDVLDILKRCNVRPYVLDRCDDGAPAHPLMLPYSCSLSRLDA